MIHSDESSTEAAGLHKKGRRRASKIIINLIVITLIISITALYCNRDRWSSLEICIVREGPLGDVRLLICEVMKRVCLAPLVRLVVLVNVASLRAGNAIERCDSSSPKPCQSTEDRSLLFGHLSPFQLINHFVRLLDTGLCQLLSCVLTA